MRSILFACLLFLIQAVPNSSTKPQRIPLDKQILFEKIKGGWAGQLVGTSLEIAAWHSDTLQTDSSNILQHARIRLENAFKKDSLKLSAVYKDLIFVTVLEEKGLHASAEHFADALLASTYPASHASRNARFNLQQGIEPSASGHWINNPNANCMDFQTQADFIGLMSPGMLPTIKHYADIIGHMMSYGEGYYSGLYIAAIYANSFMTDDVEKIISSSINLVPTRSEFHIVLREILEHYQRNSEDWSTVWTSLQKKWLKEDECGVNLNGPLDAKRNAVFVTLALLFGKKDLNQSIHIGWLSSNKSGVNLPTIVGILGVLNGFNSFPEDWQKEIENVEKMKLPYVSQTLSDAYQQSFQHALKNIEAHGGKVRNDEVLIAQRRAHPVAFERSFEGHFAARQILEKETALVNEIEFEFSGLGFMFLAEKGNDSDTSTHVVEAEVYLNEKRIDNIAMSCNLNNRTPELFWKFQLAHKRYKLRIKPINPLPEHPLIITKLVIYDLQTEACAMNQ
jgi:hypothetical protein